MAGKIPRDFIDDLLAKIIKLAALFIMRKALLLP